MKSKFSFIQIQFLCVFQQFYLKNSSQSNPITTQKTKKGKAISKWVVMKVISKVMNVSFYPNKNTCMCLLKRREKIFLERQNFFSRSSPKHGMNATS